MGAWRTEPYLSQLGMSVMSIRFGEDGTHETSVELQQIPVPPMKAGGTYRVDGNRLALASNGKEERWTWAWDGDVLVLTEPNGDTYRLLRVADDHPPPTEAPVPGR